MNDPIMCWKDIEADIHRKMRDDEKRAMQMLVGCLAAVVAVVGVAVAWLLWPSV